MMPKITLITPAHENGYSDDDACDDCKEDNDDDDENYCEWWYDEDDTAYLGSSAPGTMCKEDDIPGVPLHTDRLQPPVNLRLLYSYNSQIF